MKSVILAIIGIFLLLVNTHAGATTIQNSEKYIPFDSMEVNVSGDIENNTFITENLQISLYFTLGSGTNGIVPAKEDIEVGFNTASLIGGHKQCFILYLPANNLVKTKNWHEISDRTNPAGIGVKMLVVDGVSGEVIKDLTHTLKLFDLVITPMERKNQYYLLINAIVEHRKDDLMPLAFIGSATESVLIVGDESGSATAPSKSIEFHRN